MRTKYVNGDRVSFKKSYAGYFRDLSGKPLTILSVHTARESGCLGDGGGDRVILKEIDEIHLVNPTWLTRVVDE